jgi:RNA recognition motif-containing protein
MVKLFIGGFPLDMDEMQLAQLISPHGDISTLKIVRDKKTKICKGYAFVEVKNDEDALKVTAALDEQTIADRQLSVRLVAEPKIPPQVSKARETPPVRKKRPRL